MANPVTDKLKDWLNDADAADTNIPIASTPMGTGQSGELAGEIRRLKSEIRSLSIIMSWERWLGLKNLAAIGNIAFTYSSGTVFTVNDDFLNTNRNVAVVGRRVKGMLAGSTIYGTISVSSFSAPTTTVTVVWDTGSMDATLTEVQFGPEIRSVGGIANLPFSTATPLVNQILRYLASKWTPDYTEGVQLLTNKTGVSLVAGDVVAPDTATTSGVILADTVSTQKQLLVSLDAPANNATGRFINFGVVATVNVANATTRGHYLVKSATTKLVDDSGTAIGNTTAPPTGAFAVALGTTAGAGSVAAVLLGSTFSAVPTQLASDVQTFTSSGSWTKPAGYAATSKFIIEEWGGGGSGGKGIANSPGGGGGGGAYVRVEKVLSELTDPETVTIGAGGAAQSSSSTAGNAGGNTTFTITGGNTITAYGGGAGGYNAAGAGGGGGGGGGCFGAGSAASGATGGTGGSPSTSSTSSGNFGGGEGGNGSGFAGSPSAHGGGGGGAGLDGAGTGANKGGNSIMGGGGGGGAADSSTGGTGGLSMGGGNGGAGNSDTGGGVAGTQPGGGGGGVEVGGSSGAGGAGMARITVLA